MVQMKKIIIFLFAVIISFFFTELIVRFALHYPVYGVEKKVTGLYSDKLFFPYSEYWNVEGGNHVFSRNNLGLPGIDVKVDSLSKNVMILGTSFVEAFQFPPEDIATSVFQKKLQQNSSRFQVINLSYSGNDPYDSYFRLSYFEKEIKPSFVILLVDDIYNEWLKKHKHPLNFDSPENFGKEKSGFTQRLFTNLRNHFALINLVARALQSEENANETIETDKPISQEQIRDQDIPADLFTCLIEYKKKYSDRFLCLSIMDNDSVNAQLSSFCSQNKISFDCKKLNIEENKINGEGHLNLKGNKLLGDFFYESFIKFYKE